MSTKSISLKNLSIYKNAERTYIGRGDGYLSVLEGEDVFLVNDIFSALLDNDKKLPYQHLQQSIVEKHTVDDSFFDDIINWLTSNGILILEDDTPSSPQSQQLDLAIIGLPEDETEALLQKLQEAMGDEVRISAQSVDGLAEAENPVALLFTPILDKSISNWAQQLYESNIPHIYLDFSPYTVTLGPAVIPAIKTPCLKCFARRRIANTADPKNYMKLIRLDNEVLTKTSFLESNFHRTLLEWLAGELLRLQASKWTSAGIVAKSKSINFATDEFETAKIIKTVNCEVCNPHLVFRALNG